MDSLNHWFFHITNTLDDFGDLHFLETSTRVWVKIWCPKNWMVTKKEQNLRFGCRISPGMFFPLPRFFFPDLFCFPSPASILPLPFHAACYLQHFGAGTLACLLAGLLACTPVCENLAGKKKTGRGEKNPRKNRVPVVCWALRFDQFTYQTNSTQVHPLDAGGKHLSFHVDSLDDRMIIEVRMGNS